MAVELKSYKIVAGVLAHQVEKVLGDLRTAGQSVQGMYVTNGWLVVVATESVGHALPPYQVQYFSIQAPSSDTEDLINDFDPNWELVFACELTAGPSSGFCLYLEK